jgi:hypothetical protein
MALTTDPSAARRTGPSPDEKADADAGPQCTPVDGDAEDEEDDATDDNQLFLHRTPPSPAVIVDIVDEVFLPLVRPYAQ